MPTECGNPLFLQWIKEWLDVAKERNSKGVTTSVAPDIMCAALSNTHLTTLQKIQEGVRLDESLPLGFQSPLRSTTALWTWSEVVRPLDG